MILSKTTDLCCGRIRWNCQGQEECCLHVGRSSLWSLSPRCSSLHRQRRSYFLISSFALPVSCLSSYTCTV